MGDEASGFRREDHELGVEGPHNFMGVGPQSGHMKLVTMAVDFVVHHQPASQPASRALLLIFWEIFFFYPTVNT